MLHWQITSNWCIEFDEFLVDEMKLSPMQTKLNRTKPNWRRREKRINLDREEWKSDRVKYASDLLRRKQFHTVNNVKQTTSIHCWDPESGNIYSVVFLFLYRHLQCWQYDKIYGFFLRFDEFDSLEYISIHWMIIRIAKMCCVRCNDQNPNTHTHTHVTGLQAQQIERTNEIGWHTAAWGMVNWGKKSLAIADYRIWMSLFHMIEMLICLHTIDV